MGTNLRSTFCRVPFLPISLLALQVSSFRLLQFGHLDSVPDLWLTQVHCFLLMSWAIHLNSEELMTITIYPKGADINAPCQLKVIFGFTYLFGRQPGIYSINCRFDKFLNHRFVSFVESDWNVFKAARSLRKFTIVSCISNSCCVCRDFHQAPINGPKLVKFIQQINKNKLLISSYVKYALAVIPCQHWKRALICSYRFVVLAIIDCDLSFASLRLLFRHV